MTVQDIILLLSEKVFKTQCDSGGISGGGVDTLLLLNIARKMKNETVPPIKANGNHLACTIKPEINIAPTLFSWLDRTIMGSICHNKYTPLDTKAMIRRMSLRVLPKYTTQLNTPISGKNAKQIDKIIFNLWEYFEVLQMSLIASPRKAGKLNN